MGNGTLLFTSVSFSFSFSSFSLDFDVFGSVSELLLELLFLFPIKSEIYHHLLFIGQRNLPLTVSEIKER